MTDDKLVERGWLPQEVKPGNCVREKWTKEDAGMRAEITVSNKGEVQGLIKAVSDLTDVKKHGELLLKELQDPAHASEVIDRLLSALAVSPPYRQDQDPLLALSAS